MKALSCEAVVLATLGEPPARLLAYLQGVFGAVEQDAKARTKLHDGSMRSKTATDAARRNGNNPAKQPDVILAKVCL